MNDQHPFDVVPDDERRPADDPAPRTTGFPTVTYGPTSDTPATTGVESQIGADAIAVDEQEDDGKHRRIAALSVAAAVVFTVGAGGGAAASLALANHTAAGASTTAPGTNTAPGQGTQGGFGNGTQGGFGNGTQGGFGRGSGSSTSTAIAATVEQSTGLVIIDTQLGYENGEAAGTGIILTSNGRVLTNNHVIDGATTVKVTVEPTGKSYTADVVGTNATKDIAVLQLEDASGLQAADLVTGTSSVGDDVTAVGNANANGTGTLSAATGTVSALDQTITTSSEGTATGETLNGLIEISADVVSGDSGGPVRNSAGDVVGVTTAASSGSANVTGYAIPITTAVSIAKQIVAGENTAEFTIGLLAFLGVSISDDPSGSSTSGAVVGQVLPDTAAAKTGLAAGDTITAVDGIDVTSGAALSKAIATHQPGDRVTIHYTDTTGASRTANVTLVKGPAD